MPDQGDRKRKHGGRGGGGGRGRGGRGRGDGGDNANKKTKYWSQSNRGTGQAVPLGSRGILVTCDAGREDRAGDESVALIEEHYDKLTEDAPVGQESAAAEVAAEAPAAETKAAEGADADDADADDDDKAEGAADADGADAAEDAKADEGKAGSGGGGGGGCKDIAALLAEEVAQIKDKKAAKFRVHNTGVKGCIFVLFPSGPPPGAPGPVEVATSIAKEAQQRKQVRGRHLVRFLPVTHTCFAGLDEIQAAAPKLLVDHFSDADDATPVEFSVEYEHRSSEGFERLDVINAFTEVIKTPPHKVNLKNPAKVVLVQLIRNGCAMAVVPGYRDLAKFNVRKLAEVEEAA